MNSNEERYELALSLLKFKALKQMCEGKTTCTINEDDVKEILYIAGINLKDELEVM